LSPLPILSTVNPLNLFAIFMDSIFCLIVYCLALVVNWKVSKVFIIIFIISSIIFSIWEFYIGGAVRHRMPLVAILLPLASYGFVTLVDKLKRRKF